MALLFLHGGRRVANLDSRTGIAHRAAGALSFERCEITRDCSLLCTCEVMSKGELPSKVDI